jgi:hypothetical protein
MYYGFRLNEQKEWTKIKTFNSIEEFKEYIERRRVVYAKLLDEKTYNKYYANKAESIEDDIE